MIKIDKQKILHVLIVIACLVAVFMKRLDGPSFAAIVIALIPILHWTTYKKEELQMNIDQANNVSGDNVVLIKDIDSQKSISNPNGKKDDK